MGKLFCLPPSQETYLGYDDKAFCVERKECDSVPFHSVGSLSPLLRNSRKTDSLPATKSAEFLFRLAPPESGRCASKEDRHHEHHH